MDFQTILFVKSIIWMARNKKDSAPLSVTSRASIPGQVSPCSHIFFFLIFSTSFLNNMIFVLICFFFLFFLLLCYVSPLLTWRDVQHIIVKTSRAGHLSAPDWKTNAAGYNGMCAHTLKPLLPPSPAFFFLLTPVQLSRVRHTCLCWICLCPTHALTLMKSRWKTSNVFKNDSSQLW